MTEIVGKRLRSAVTYSAIGVAALALTVFAPPGADAAPAVHSTVSPTPIGAPLTR